MKIQPLNHQHIAELLTRSTDQMDNDILSALQQARAVALQKQRVRQPVFSLSAIGHHAHMPHTPQQWVASTILLAAILVGAFGYWQHSQIPVDLEILTDDMPIEVFVDQPE